jgi:hypothetical protein
VSITASQHEVELEERTREAWSRYAEDLRALQGRPYEEAEEAAWDRLQDALADIAADRADLAIGHSG